MKSTLNLILISSFLGFCACSGNADEKNQSADLELEKQKIEIEKEKLKLEKEKQQLELDQMQKENELEKQKEIQRQNAENLILESKFQYSSYSYVVADKAYFHAQPDPSTKSKKKFLVSGDNCDVVRTKNGFGYVNFYNEAADKTTSGWIDLRDVEPFPQGE